MAKKSMIAKAKRKPKYSVRKVNRCNRCGRPRGYYRQFGLCRVCVREADRLDLELGFNIQSGWNLGGPTVTPAQAAKEITWSRQYITGEMKIGETINVFVYMAPSPSRPSAGRPSPGSRFGALP